jgi:hypothetical protein
LLAELTVVYAILVFSALFRLEDYTEPHCIQLLVQETKKEITQQSNITSTLYLEDAG